MFYANLKQLSGLNIYILTFFFTSLLILVECISVAPLSFAILSCAMANFGHSLGLHATKVLY